ncbi:hypothetical protein [Sunxiuqinia indica]|uniref:hypothetical protein n=1 Tax=Sunxiuqinia indica TaxID=2692584 RepID=UPI001356D571|nr:hypothetical protein [Sunxiuqinia indica]
MYSKEFNDLVEKGVKENFYLGTGRPDSRILIVGKEVAIGNANDLEIQNRKNYLNNAIDWKSNIKKNIVEVSENWEIDRYLQDESARNNPLFAFKGVKIADHKAGQTWRKYQKLHDQIFKIDSDNEKAYDFQERFFITEMSDNPFPTTSKAKKLDEFKIKLQERKETFFKSEFIKQFPVVVLACGDYIHNGNEIREIDEIFEVTYAGDERGKYWYSKGNWFYIHHNRDRSKLVIHTRQLSANVKGEMLFEMGKVIREFTNSSGISLE